MYKNMSRSFIRSSCDTAGIAANNTLGFVDGYWARSMQDKVKCIALRWTQTRQSYFGHTVGLASLLLQYRWQSDVVQSVQPHNLKPALRVLICVVTLFQRKQHNASTHCHENIII